MELLRVNLNLLITAALSLGKMAIAFGHIEAFHPESDSIKAYLERAGLYFVANNIPEDKTSAYSAKFNWNLYLLTIE